MLTMPQHSTVNVTALQALPIFSALAEPVIDHLVKTSRIHKLKPRQRISALAQKGNESYCFVVSGQVAIVLDHGGGGGGGKKPSAELDDLEFIGSFAPGELFSDGFLDCAPKEGGVALDCMAQTQVTLLSAHQSTLSELLQGNHAWAACLAQAMSDSRRRFLSQQEPSRRFVQDFYLRHGFESVGRIRVSEAIRCLDCNKCEEACAKRHGKARMVRAHARLGRLTFQQFCMQCTDQACLDACSFDALSVNIKGEIVINDNCGGCGACARKCPHGAIAVVEIPYKPADFPHPVPTSDSRGMTTVPGLYVAGSVRGPVSTKLAAQEAKHVVDNLPPRRSTMTNERVLDVVVVGAGNTGLAAAKRCHERQLDFMVVEKQRDLSTKAAASVSQLKIRPGLPAERIAQVGNGVLRVDTKEGPVHAENVLVCTGKPEPAGQVSLLEQAGVQMVAPGSKAMEGYAALRGTHQIGIKCDNCSAYADRACLRACPTGCLVEMKADDLFLGPVEDNQGKERNFSGVAFVEGVTEQRARQKKHPRAHAVLSVLVVLALAAIGLEAFLRSTMPEHSVEGLVRAWLGNHETVWYGSGKGFGHWLGYIGASSMLLTLFYPLHTRCGVLKNWGAQSTWLTVHLWVGFIGATLVTYHAAFKLDRWSGLACYAMWIVILSGAIGRYLYGMVHSGIGLVEFEREALARSTASLTARHNLDARVARLLSESPGKPDPMYAVLPILLWQELRDFVLFLRLRFGGLAHIPDRQARRQTLRYLADLAAHQRARRYLESARRLLRYWNWVHIVLTIVMFVLAGFHITYGFMYKAV
jgi:Fe-S-cluster-containing hydrogenase component 2